MIIEENNIYLARKRQAFMLQGVEYGLVIALLLVFSGATTHLGPVAYIGRIISYPVLILLISIHWKKFILILSKDFFLLTLILIAMLSIEWSISPDVTLDHGRGLLRSTALGAYLAARYEKNKQLQLLSIVFGICILLSLIFALAFPSIGAPYYWQGAFSFKNALGRAMTVSSQVFLLLALSASSKKIQKWLYWLGYFLSALLILLSGSTTALATTIMLSCFIPSFNFLKRFLRQRSYKFQVTSAILSLLSIVGLVFSVVSFSEFLLGTQGKDLSFTGRTDLWDLLLEKYISQRPFWGYGYRAFWNEFGDAISLDQKWNVTHAHNGFLELILSLGLLGLFLFLLSFIPALSKAFLRMTQAKTYIDFWPFQIVALMAITDFTIEASILASGNIIWIIFVSVALSLNSWNRTIKSKKL